MSTWSRPFPAGRRCWARSSRFSLRLDDSKNLVDGPLHLVVHHDVVETAGLGHLPPGLRQAAVQVGLRLGPPGPQATSQLLLGGWLEEDQDRLGDPGPDGGGALDVDLQQDVAPQPESLLDGLGGRAVPLLEHLGPFQQVASLDHGLEPVPGDEAVVDPLGLAGARIPRGHGDREEQVGTAAQQSPDHGPLPHPRRAGDHEEPAGTLGEAVRGVRGGPAYFLANSPRSASFCFAPRPRTRRLVEMSSRSMSFRARTFPTPGSASSTAETFILATMLSSRMLRTSRRLVCPALSRSFSSARFLRASAALARASRRCSSVRVGSGMVSSFDPSPETPGIIVTAVSQEQSGKCNSSCLRPDGGTRGIPPALPRRTWGSRPDRRRWPPHEPPPAVGTAARRWTGRPARPLPAPRLPPSG